MRDRLTAWLEVRSAAVIATVALVVLGMAYSLLWLSTVDGGPLRLSVGPDLWSFTTSAKAILHGHFSAIYYKNSALTSPPAFELAISPVVGLGEALGLSPHLHGGGQALSLWLIVGPAALLVASVAIFAVDAVARIFAISESNRIVLALMSGVGVADVAIFWGHPEVCISLALVIWAALVVNRGDEASLTRAGWLLGFAIAFQPLAVLGVAPVLARATRGERGSHCRGALSCPVSCS